MSLDLIPGSDQAEEVLVFLIVAGTGLFVLALIGPAGLLIFALTLFLISSYHLSLRLTAALTALPFCLFLLFPSLSDPLYWSARFETLIFMVTTEGGWGLWLTSLSLHPAGLLSAILLAGALRVLVYLLQHSPNRRINSKLQQARTSLRRSSKALHALVRANRKSAVHLQDKSCIGVEAQSGKPVLLPDKSLNTHLLIAGTTGSGKTVTLLNCVESFIERQLPVIFIDGKGDLQLKNRVLGYAARFNRETRGFAMAGPSCLYNPFEGNYTALKDKVIGLRKAWSEEHYLKLAEGYLQTVFKILQATKTPITLPGLPAVLDLQALTLLVRNAVHDKQLNRDTGQQLLHNITAQEEAAKHVESLKAELNNLANSSLGPLFNVCSDTSEDQVLSFQNILATKGVAYIALTPMIYPEVSGVLGRLILNDLKASLDPLHPQKVLLVIDEVSTLVSTGLLNFLNQGRYLGLHIILSIQSLADLGQSVPGHASLFMRQVIANCNLFIVHKMNDSEDAQALADILGTQADIDLTAQVAAFGIGTGLGSARLVHEYCAHPDQIKSLKRGEAFLLDKNSETGVVRFLARKGDLAL